MSTNTHLAVHPALCFQDATVAVLAGSSYFMVHAGLLARHSLVFADTFKAGAPAQRFRGRPVFEVQDDSQDMAFFLLALYDGTYVPPSSILSQETSLRQVPISNMTSPTLPAFLPSSGLLPNTRSSVSVKTSCMASPWPGPGILPSGK